MITSLAGSPATNGKRPNTTSVVARGAPRQFNSERHWPLGFERRFTSVSAIPMLLQLQRSSKCNALLGPNRWLKNKLAKNRQRRSLRHHTPNFRGRLIEEPLIMWLSARRYDSRRRRSNGDFRIADCSSFEIVSKTPDQPSVLRPDCRPRAVAAAPACAGASVVAFAPIAVSADRSAQL